MVIVIVDFAHCGTTMMAGALEILSVPMVGEDNYDTEKREDIAVIKALQKGDDAFSAIVAERSAQHRVWGFKWPGAWRYMDRMQAYLRDPVYLAIYKDVVSVTRRRFGYSNTRWVRKLRNTARQMRESLDGLYACDVPVETFSYYHAVTRPVQFVGRLARVAGCKDRERMDLAASYIQPNLAAGPRHPYPSVEGWLA